MVLKALAPTVFRNDPSVKPVQAGVPFGSHVRLAQGLRKGWCGYALRYSMGDLKEWMMIMQAALAAAWVIEQNHRQMMLAAAILLADSSDDEIDEDNDSDDHGGDEAEPKRKRQRTVSPRPDYSESEWGKLLKSDSLNDPISGDAKLFRKQFRVPYPFFLKLVKLVKEKEWFPRRSKDIAGQDCIPIELKVSLSESISEQEDRRSTRCIRAGYAGGFSNFKTRTSRSIP